MTDKNIISNISESIPVEKGDVVWVAADLTRLAFALRRAGFGFYPEMLIDMLKEKIGEEGTIIIPAFNHSLKARDQFDIRKTRPITGALALSLMGRKDFRRTQHPLHSFFVWGRLSEKLAGLNNESSFGEDSPFALLLREKAKFLLIGTRIRRAFSFTHYVEEQIGVTYRKYRTYHIRYTDATGNTSRRMYRMYAKKTGYTMQLDRLEKLLEDKDIMQQKIIYGTTFTVAGLQDAYEVIREDIQNNNANNIASFNINLYLRHKAKKLLNLTLKYRTTSDKIKP
jgi:aminoglycoside 3-N-acetyltransferase